MYLLHWQMNYCLTQHGIIWKTTEKQNKGTGNLLREGYRLSGHNFRVQLVVFFIDLPNEVLGCMAVL